MSERTNIAWAHGTFNPWWGCKEKSAGCANCYARRLAKRFGKPELWQGKREFHPKALKELARWNRRPWVCSACNPEFGVKSWATLEEANSPAAGTCFNKPKHRRRVFTGSMMDLFDPAVEVEWLAQALDAIRRADQLTHIIVTKRPELWSERFKDVCQHWYETSGPHGPYDGWDTWAEDWLNDKPPKNIWLLASVEDQKAADERIPHLLRIPAAVRGLSLEPLLGPVDLTLWIGAVKNHRMQAPQPIPSYKPAIDWLVIGGESGPGARPCNVEWIRSLVKQGRQAGVPVFVKQLGASIQDRNDAGYDGETPQEWPMGTVCNTATCCEYQGQMGRVVTRSRKGGDPSEWPEDLRRQEWPK